MENIKGTVESKWKRSRRAIKIITRRKVDRPPFNFYRPVSSSVASATVSSSCPVVVRENLWELSRGGHQMFSRWIYTH